MIQNHHEGYIEWAEFERNQHQLAANNYGHAGGAKSSRGGRALLAGLLSCGRCGRRLKVNYRGRQPGQPIYRCDPPNLQLGLPRCQSFGGARVDDAIAAELLRAVEPLAVEAALDAERRVREREDERRRIMELELQQARYEAGLAERRYTACDPDHRLIAARLEQAWEAALRRAQACQARLDAAPAPMPTAVHPDFSSLAGDLHRAWNAPGVTMRTRQRLLRVLVTDIIADVDESTREILLTIHWRGGQHSSLRVQKPKTGEHRRRAPDEAVAVLRRMAGRWNDEAIAATLNRMGFRTGQGNTWNASRVRSLRAIQNIRAYRSAGPDGQWLTLTEAAKQRGVSHHAIRRLIKEGLLAAEQVVPGAPYQIRACDLKDEAISRSLARTHRPCRMDSDSQLSIFSMS